MDPNELLKLLDLKAKPPSADAPAVPAAPTDLPSRVEEPHGAGGGRVGAAPRS